MLLNGRRSPPGNCGNNDRHEQPEHNKQGPSDDQQGEEQTHRLGHYPGA